MLNPDRAEEVLAVLGDAGVDRTPLRRRLHDARALQQARGRIHDRDAQRRRL